MKSQFNIKFFIINLLAIIVCFAAILLLFKLNVFSTKPPIQSINQTTIVKENSMIVHPQYPDTIDFCGERMPLERQDVREAFEYELLKIIFWHSENIVYLKRMTKFFPIVEPILKQYNVPDDFKYLLVVESGMANVVSPSKAEGYWQFMKPTAIEYGLEVNDEVDERYDIEKATVAACKYILNSYSKLKSWTLVAASYNSGVEYIQKSLNSQKVDNFYDLLIYVETARYVYRVVVYKLFLSNPQSFGYNIEPQYQYKNEPVDYVKVTGSIEDLATFAQNYNTTYRQIKLLNPWLRNNKLTNSKSKTYYIKVPKLKK